MKSLQIYSNNFLKYATAPDGVTWPEGVEKLFNNNRLDPFTYPGTSLTLDFLVKDASGLAASRSADCIIIKNSNIAAVNLQWYTLDGVIKPGAAFTVNGQDIMYFLPETLTSGRFVLNITAMPGSAALSIGTLQCCRFIVEPCARTETDIAAARGADSYRTYGGQVVHFSAYRKKDFSVSIKNCPKQDYDLIYAAIAETEELIVAFWEDYEPLDVYEAYIDPEISKEVNRRTGLIDFKMKGQEL